MIEAGIFDLGGVVVYSNDHNLLDDIQHRLQIDDDEKNSIADAFANTIGTGKISEEEYWQKFELSHPGKTVPRDIASRAFEKDLVVFDDSKKLIDDLKTNGVRAVALSNTIPSHVAVMRAKGVLDLFDVEIFSYEVGFRKPDKRIYEVTLEKLGLSPKQTVFVDDREENVIAAEKIGIRSFLYKGANHLRAQLEDMGLL